MGKRNKRGIAFLIIAALVSTIFAPMHVSNAYYQEPAYVHDSNYILRNGSFESGSGTAAEGWLGWNSGYQIDSSQAHTGSKSVKCSLTVSAGECGVYQFAELNRADTLPLRISAWSKAQGISGSSNEDYSIWVDLTYMDNTHKYGEAKAFQTGTHDWEHQELYIDPEKPVKNLTIYGLLRNKAGTVWFDDITVEEFHKANLLTNNGMENVSGSTLAAWGSWKNGYSVAANEGRGGSVAARITNPAGNGQYGLYQVANLNRTYTRPVLIRGWSKADNVSGSPDSDYSLYADIVYHDGTAAWGLNMPFDTGTHDWQPKQLYFDPVKPIKTITVYALFNNHSGTVRFDNISVEELQHAQPSMIAMKKQELTDTGTELLLNGELENTSGGTVNNWGSFGLGYATTTNQGRNGSKAVVMENTTSSDARAIYQTVELNRTEKRVLVLSAWSKSENVDGDPDNGYSLYMDLVYQDGTRLYAQTAPFGVGTHDWQKKSLYFYPEKPVKTIVIYGMFRDFHKGKVWFDDISVKEVNTEAAAFEDALVNPVALPQQTAYNTLQSSDGLSLSLSQNGVKSLKIDGTELANAATPSGFLVRDQASQSDVYAFSRIPDANLNNYKGTVNDLGLEIDANFTSLAKGIKVSGRLKDTKQTDRAVSLTFALPVDATNWKWGDDIRRDRIIQTGHAADIYSNTNIVDYETGPMSIYPTSAIYDPNSGKGLSIAVDFAIPTHYRLDYNGGTKQLLITFEFGLAADTAKFPSSADFSFMIYRFDAISGFRGAFDHYMKLVPEQYNVRIPDQGIWMPFAPIRQVQGWQDFGFRFKEGDDQDYPLDVQHANANGILVFHYQEISSWWQPVDPSLPKTVQTAVSQRDISAAQGNEMARVAQSADMRNMIGNPYLQWLDVPWNQGPAWMINASPDIPGNPNSYNHYFSEDKLAARYTPTSPYVDGEYLDTLDGWPYSANYNRNHFTEANTPLVFSKVTYKPVIHRAFSNWEAVKRLADRMHAEGHYLMANGTPHVYAMYMPWLDAAGNERNWLGENNTFVPDNDATLSKYRTLSGQKPYLMLQNTDFSKFTYDDMDKYMQRSLFYGIFPSAFSQAADDNSNYWKNPAFYNRDRALFVKYVPVVKEVAEAGWEVLTHADSSNSKILVERFGAGDTVYLTVLNDPDRSSLTTQTASITIDPASMGLTGTIAATELLSGNHVTVVNNQITVTLNPDEVKVIKFVAVP